MTPGEPGYQPDTTGTTLQEKFPTTVKDPASLRITAPWNKFFAYSHLPPHLQQISLPFAALAEFIAANIPYNPEVSEALRKLLEAKDCAVRAQVFGHRPEW